MSTAQRRRRRSQASDRLQMAWIAAIIAAILGTLLTIWEAFHTAQWVTTLPYISAVGFTVWLAWMVRRYQSQFAAGLLLLNALVTPVARLIQTGDATVLIVAMAFILYINTKPASSTAKQSTGDVRGQEVYFDTIRGEQSS